MKTPDPWSFLADQAETRVAAVLIAFMAGAMPAAAQAVQRIGATPAGAQAGVTFGRISGDGRYAIFSTPLDILGTNSGNQLHWQVYRRQLSTGQVELVTIGFSGGFGNGYSLPEGTSHDGQFVVFSAQANNLTPVDQNAQLTDVFVRDMATGVTEIVSLSTGGLAGNDESGSTLGGGEVSVSDDGRYVAFKSLASNLVLGDLNAMADVFVRDRFLQTTTRVSVSSVGSESTYPASPNCPGFPGCVIKGVSISGDSRYVAFGSSATNLAANDLNQQQDVFVHDTTTGVTELVSRTPGGVSGSQGSSDPTLSYDGRVVAFRSAANDLVPGTPVLGNWQVFVLDRLTSGMQLASVGASGVPANGDCYPSDVSNSGQYVVFASDSTNISPPDTNADFDAFLRDLAAGTTVRVSNAIGGGAANGYSIARGVSADGTQIVLDSTATDMVVGDFLGGAGVALVDRTVTAPPIITFCTGKANSLNCVPAISPTGLPSISGKYAFFVTAARVLNNRKGALIWGTAPASTPFMGGTLCVQAPISITAPQDSHGNAGNGSDCSGWHSFRMTPQWMQVRGWTAGTTINCQYFCRDPAFGAPNQIAITEGLRFVVVP